MNLDDIIIKIKNLNNGKVLATAVVDFGDFSIKGFRIMNGSDYTGNNWVNPPSYRSKDGKWHPIFFIKEKEMWAELQEKVLDEYNQFMGQKEFTKTDNNPPADEELKELEL